MYEKKVNAVGINFDPLHYSSLTGVHLHFGFGIEGLGHTISITSSGQKGHMDSIDVHQRDHEEQ